VHTLLGDCSKARNQLGWSPRTSFQRLVHMMVDADLERVKSEMLKTVT
jgi:GDPmannose 4,6-dehydratase